MGSSKTQFLGERPFLKLIDFYHELGGPAFFVPALIEDKKLKGTKLWRDRPMAHAQWVKIVRKVMASLGKGKKEADEFTYNSAC